MSMRDFEYDAGLAHHRLAEKYLRAAQVVYDATFREGQSLDFNALFAEYEPLVFLCAHSMELNFKAYLIAHGMSVKETKTFRHNLGKLARECFAWGMAIPDWAKATIDTANAIFTRSRLSQSDDFRVRYPSLPDDGATELLFPNFTIRTAQVISELGGSAARQRLAIVFDRIASKSMEERGDH